MFIASLWAKVRCCCAFHTLHDSLGTSLSYAYVCIAAVSVPSRLVRRQLVLRKLECDLRATLFTSRPAYVRLYTLLQFIAHTYLYLLVVRQKFVSQNTIIFISIPHSWQRHRNVVVVMSNFCVLTIGNLVLQLKFIFQHQYKKILVPKEKPLTLLNPLSVHSLCLQSPPVHCPPPFLSTYVCNYS